MQSMISVCMATFNGEKYIQRQLLSILEQLNVNDEIIISDDHSTDNTLKVIESMNDNRIKVFLNDKAKGYSHNFENALCHASGSTIFLSDQDDFWLNNKVEIVSKKLEEFDYVVCDYDIVDANLNRLLIKKETINKGFLKNIVKCKHLGCTMAFNKKVLNAILPFPSNDILCPHDLWIALVAQCYFKCDVLEEKLMYYVRHGENASDGNLKKSTNSIFRMVKIRLYSIFCVFKRRFRL